MFKGLWREAMELSRDNKLRERLYQKYSIDELHKLVTSEAYSAVESIFPVLHAVPQTESAFVNGRTYSTRLNEYECRRKIWASLRDFTNAGAYYLHGGPESLLKNKRGIDATLASLQVSWHHYSLSALKALRSFKSATITLEVGSVTMSHRAPITEPLYWRGKLGSRTYSPFSPPYPRLYEYPEDFAEIKAAAREWWQRGDHTPTDLNRQFKAVWDQIHHLHEALPILENYWRSLETRGSSLAREIEKELISS